MLPLCDRPGAPALLLAALVLVGAFAAFPFGCDAEYVVFDPVWYAAGAERAVAKTVIAHHPLFHLLVVAVAKPLQALGVPHAGHVGIRLLSGAGAAVILLLLAGLSGRTRWRVGAGLAVLLLATRSWFLEAFTGENVLPAIAAALIALLAALDDRWSLRSVGIATFIALLFRQDNLLVVPAILLAVRWRSQGPSWRQLTVWLAVVGGATLGAYLAIWAGLSAGGLQEGFLDWMWGIGARDYSLVGRPVLQHAVAYGTSITGVQWPATEPWTHIWIGAGGMCLVLACGAFFRGTARWERLAFLALVVAVPRFAFYAWFEPTNTEWTLFTWTLAAVVAARAANGTAKTPLPVRRAAALLVLIAGVATWSSHGSYTLSFREHHYQSAGEWVKEHTPKSWRRFGYQNRGVHAIESQGLAAGPLPTEFEDARRYLQDLLAKDKKPTVVVVDVAIQTGMPYHVRQLRERWRNVAPDDPPLARVLWSSGGIYVVGFLVP